MTTAPQTRPRIFVSHSSQDNEFGVRLVEDLRGKLGGVDSVWYDSQGGLYGGDTWWHTITEELTTRPVFIVILSPDAVASKWVLDEINMAWKQKNAPGPVGKNIIPILYRECKVPEYLNTIQMISFLPPESYEHAFQKLLDTLYRKPTGSLTWSDLCNSSKNITKKGLQRVRLEKNLYLEQLYVQRENVHEQFMRFLDDPQTRCFVLIGKSGVGKSSFLLSLAEELQAEERPSQECQTLLLLYDGGRNRNKPFMEAIDQDFSRELGRKIEDIWQEINKIDGIDQHFILLCIDAVNENERAKELVKQVNTLVGEDWPWLKVLLICRPETWRIIKQGIPLADSLYYRGEEEGTAEALRKPFNYSLEMKPFSRQELPLAYANYQRANQVQTAYKDLSPRIREIISDPFNLWLVTTTHKMIPETLKTTTLIEEYVSALTDDGERLQGRDPEWLENQLMPLMISEGHYYKVITSEELKTADQALYRALLDGADSSGPPQLKSFRNLMDADILKREPRGRSFEIAFKSERFYEYFAGRSITNLSEKQADRYAFFLRLIKEIPGKPFLWGAVRDALVEEAKKPNSETLLKLCRTTEQRVKEMMVDVLITLGRDFPEQVGRILRNLIPQEKKATGWRKGQQLLGKVTDEVDIASRNAARIAIEVASNLCIPWVLQTAALQANSTIRTAAVRYVYYLWQRDPNIGFEILEYLAEKATRGFIPNKIALESAVGLTAIIFFEHSRDEAVLRRLQSIWREVIAKLLRIREGSSKGEGAVRAFIREQLFSFVITIALRYLGELPGYNVISKQGLEAFFRLEAKEKTLYRNLIQYLDVEGSYSKEQMENDYLEVIKIDNLLLTLATIMGLVAHACHDPSAFLPFLKKLFEEAKSDVVAYPHLTDITKIAENVLDRDPMIDEVFDFFVYTVEVCQEYYTRYRYALHNDFSKVPDALYLGSYALYQYQRKGTARTEWLESRIQAALLPSNTLFFNLLLTTELPLIGIEHQKPLIALDVLALFFNSAEIRPMIQFFLARLRVHYPDEVDNFLEEQDAPDEFRLQVQTSEPSEKIGELIGQRSWYFLRDEVLMNSPHLRSELMSILEKAVDCKNIGAWLNYFIREVINLIYGGEVLHQAK